MHVSFVRAENFCRIEERVDAGFFTRGQAGAANATFAVRWIIVSQHGYVEMAFNQRAQVFHRKYRGLVGSRRAANIDAREKASVMFQDSPDFRQSELRLGHV